MLINTIDVDDQNAEDWFVLRREAVGRGVPYFTTVEAPSKIDGLNRGDETVADATRRRGIDEGADAVRVIAAWDGEGWRPLD